LTVNKKREHIEQICSSINSGEPIKD